MKTILSICLTLIVFGLKGQTAEDVLSTWDKHAEMNYLILNYIEENHLKDVNDSTSRNVGDQFAHIHNVRMMWLGKMKEAEGIDAEIDSSESRSKDYLLKTLKASDELVRKTLEDALKSNSKIGEMSAVRFMGYLISHESHTRGQIVLALKNSGHDLPPNIGFGIWSW